MLKKELHSFEKFSSQSQNIINNLERNVEKLNKKSQKEKNQPTSGASDLEQLKEEVREMEDKLKCPICHKKDKDAILSECFHSFCYECIDKRYETRQRKCPKCGRAFSKQQYHKINLS